MKVLVIGGGGREHALVDAIDRSPLLTELFVAPGNPGMEGMAERLALDTADHEAVVATARDKGIDLVVIGPEAPLVAGLADALDDAGIAVFGPTAAAARLEGSKAFARDFCGRHGIPQPGFARFEKADDAIEHIKARYGDGGCVVKADGLAAGKGVVVADNPDQAVEAVTMMLDGGAFGSAGASVVIEDRITGTEASLFAMVDGGNAILLGSAQDYKRAHDGDKGPNTGGMGSVSPAPALTDALRDRAWEEIVLPVVAGMEAEGAPYRGFLYCGLMLTETGPQVIEFNCRFGDPEAETILPRLMSDLLAGMVAATEGGLGHTTMRFDEGHAVTVIMVNGGYPGDYAKGAVIEGLDKKGESGVTVFHAGTDRDGGGAVIATGGRVLAVTALGASRDEARDKAYKRVGEITWKDCFFRKDIAKTS